MQPQPQMSLASLASLSLYSKAANVTCVLCYKSINRII